MLKSNELDINKDIIALRLKQINRKVSFFYHEYSEYEEFISSSDMVPNNLEIWNATHMHYI